MGDDYALFPPGGSEDILIGTPLQFEFGNVFDIESVAQKLRDFWARILVNEQSNFTAMLLAQVGEGLRRNFRKAASMA